MKQFFTWNKKQIRALNGSIKKWEKIVAGTDVDRGTLNCPCCKNWYKNECNRCPIAIFNDSCECLHTPYYDYAHSENEKERHELAKKELKFLNEVLKAGVEE